MTDPTAYQSFTSLTIFLRSLSKKLSLAVILIGVVVILGWGFNLAILKGILPGLPTMKVNTALCFILGGSSLWLWHQQLKIKKEKSKRKPQFLIFNFAFLIVLIASLTLIQYGFKLNLGIDQLLMQQPEPVGSTAVLGRMAPNTAFAFLIIGSALLLMSNRYTRVGAIQCLAVLTWLISFVGLLGHVYGSVYFYTAGSYTGMALHTAIAFQLLSVGLLCAFPDRGIMSLITDHGIGSVMMRRLLPVAIFLVLLIGGVSSFGYRLHLYGQEIEAALSSTLEIAIFAGLVGWNAQSLNRIDLKRRQAEQELQQTNAHLQHYANEIEDLYNNAPCGYHSLDAEGTIVRINNTELNWLGYSREELLNQKKFSELLTPTSLQDFQENYPKFKQRGYVNDLEFELIRKDGSTLHVSLNGTAIRDAAGNYLMSRSSLFDISDRKQAEVSLARLAAIVEYSGDALISKSLDGTILSWNKAAEKIFGYKAAEIIGEPMTRLIPSHLIRKEQQILETVQRGETIEQYETVRLHKDGQQIHISATVAPLKNSTGRIIGASVTKRDISDRKRIEDERKQTEARYRAIVEDQTELICRFLPDSTMLFVNDAYCRYFGLKPEDVIGRSYQPIVFEDDQEQVSQLVRTMNRDNPTVLIENRVVVNGEVRWTQWINRMLFDEHGNFVEYQSVGRDISDLKRAELERQAISDRLNFLLNYSPIVIFSSKPDGDYGATFISENVKDVLGYEAKAFLGDSEFWVNRLHPDDVSRVLDGLANLFIDDFYFHEYRLLRADGVYRWFLAQLRLIRDAIGKPVEILGYLIDISDRKQIEEQLRRNEAALIEAQRVAHLGNWELDLTTQQFTWSEELFHMFGFDQAHPEPTYAEHFNYIHPDDREMLQVCITQASEHGTPYKIDLRFFRKDGTIGYMETRGRTLQDEQGQVIRLFGTALDISDRKQAEEALHQSEATLRSFFNSGSMMMGIVELYDNDIRHISDNEASAQFFGTTPAALHNQFASILGVRRDHINFWLGHYHEAQRTQTPVRFEYAHQTSNGEKWLSVTVCAIATPANCAPRCSYIIEDISDRKYAEEALRLSQKQLQLALEASGDGLWDWNIPTGEVYYSPQYMTMLGYEVGELPNNLETWEYLIHPDDQSWVLDILNAHFKDSSASYSFDYRVRTKSGDWKWVADYGKVVARDEQGNPLRMIGTHKDISDRKRIEAALQKSVERERAIAEVIQHMRQTLNLETIFAATTQELRRVLECDRTLIYRFNPNWSGAVVAESVGRGWVSAIDVLTDNDNFALHTIERDRCIIKRWDSQEAALQDTYVQQTQGNLYSEETQYTSVSDIYRVNFEPCYIELLERFQARAYLTVPIFSNHKLWGLLASYQNSSPREWRTNEIQVASQIVTQLGIAIQQAELFVQIQQQSCELQRAKEAAEVANQSKSLFLANMSHELRTPLNVILGFTQLLRRDLSLSLAQQETIQTIHRSGEHLLSLINDILDLSKIEAERTIVEANSFDLFELLRNLEEMLRQRAISKNLQFRFEIAPNIPQFITIDTNKLRQILINLLSNAIKFTDHGSVTLRVEIDSEGVGEAESGRVEQHLTSPTLHLLFKVEDTGVGIAEDEIQSVFDAFVQSRSGKMATGGTGLGLTISRRFARLMNGDISVTSSLGQGSTFCLRLPVHVADASSIPLSTPQRQLVGLVPGQPTYRILIVDDQSENRLLLTRLMTQLGMEIREATNGQEAITLCQQWHPHLIWMDIRMPVLDGYEAAQQIRTLSPESPPIVIALTAQASMSDRNLALTSGCNDFVTKPFDENLLYDKMAEYLNLQFVYADNPQRSDSHLFATQNIPTVLTAESFSVMSEDWLTALHRAAQACDEDEIEQLLQQIPDAHTPLATQLRQLTHDYQFGQIKRLLREHFDRNR